MDDNREGAQHTVTDEDVKNNPELSEAGVSVGEEIELGPQVNEDGSELEETPEEEAADA